MKNDEIAGNLDTRLLKIIAGICMVIDHAGVRLFHNMTEMRLIGRVAFPLYVWCLVVGACYTGNAKKYALRLLLAGLISQPFYMLGLNHGWRTMNVFCTLLTGYLGVLAIRKKWHGSQLWGPALALLFACFVEMDYGWRGVLLIMLMYLVRRNRGAIAALMVAFCLFWGSNSYAVKSLLGIPLQGGLMDLDLFRAFFKLQGMAVLALPLILWPRRTRISFPPRWVGYAIYPGHLLILWIIQLLLGITTVQNGLQLLIPGWM
ncbi:MAG: hypothetical protein IJ214_10570 [Clostridia bacterium]|nr:hypothetical protein [Clostridia bacterium]